MANCTSAFYELAPRRRARLKKIAASKVSVPITV
jgi:hypothetical protein